MKVTLNIRTADDEPLATFIQIDGVTVIEAAADSIRGDAERWLARGLLEWIRTPDEATPRVTPSAAAEFLPRLSRYLENQFAFRSGLLYELPSTTSATTWRSNQPVASPRSEMTALRKRVQAEPAVAAAMLENSIEMVR